MDTFLEPLPSPSDLQSQAPAPKKKSVFKKILGAIFIGALLGVSMSIGFFIGDVVITPVDLGLSGLQKGTLLAGIFVLLPFAIAIHEGGHLSGRQARRLSVCAICSGAVDDFKAGQRDQV